ncbi:preprotein translocase subunit Tim44 [Vibrio albus]|jgi:predicted lipid-binding transport protein (Tim44 family)|uniref:Preprotein translocase subunit Tim44 n=1 Tax=Vibrio albus TaxID=2200953 RepID=A0A2U3BBV8_9VIBR|nr:TIM44-like domain-containing protein [Vibrio albus]PWI34281.1 preprotein translocase subunit Tim44 [Vibrio albus]
MKRIFAIVALLMLSVAVTPVAEAKRFGGGKSFGKLFKTAPAPKQKATNTSSINKQPTASQTNRRGLMGGLLGGLLAGGLLAAFFGGAFNGIQFMDILIIGLIAYFIFKFMRGMLGAKAGSMNQRQGYAYTGSEQFETSQPNFQNVDQPQSAGFGATGHSDVPHNTPPGFDHTAFIDGAREHYRIIQGAWNYNELHTIQEYVSTELFEQLKEERAQLQGEQHTDVMYIDAEIVRADYDASHAQLSLQFKGRYRDAVEGVEEDIDDTWHLERDLTIPNAPWLIVGIQGS